MAKDIDTGISKGCWKRKRYCNIWFRKW